MTHSTDSTSKTQVTTLTKNQRATIDRLMVKYPAITPESVRYHYEHYHYARNWFVTIEIDPEAYYNVLPITRCDHAHTADIKAKAVRAYIASKQGGAQ